MNKEELDKLTYGDMKYLFETTSIFTLITLFKNRLALEEDKLAKINEITIYCEDIESRAIDISDTDYDLGQDSVARDILKILKGEDNE